MVETTDDAKGDLKAIPAGYTFFGQFVDHDLTFDPRSSLQKANDPDNLEDFRTPAFDLDNVYGRGPDDQPYLYENEGGAARYRLRTGTAISAKKGDDIAGGDLPRTGDGTAVIGDMRNDENLIVSQIQAVFLRFHNSIVAALSADGLTGNKDLFAEAQRVARWHYQWVVVHDWLRRLCGDAIVDEILDANGGGKYGKPKLRFYHYERFPFMPVEFSVAAYRLGHSTMRRKYRLNADVELPLFGTPPRDLQGGHPVPAEHVISWRYLLDFKKYPGVAQSCRKIDHKLCSPVIHLPDSVAQPGDVPSPDFDPNPSKDIRRSLAYRNLLRAYRLGLPSGQAVARRIGVTPKDILPGKKKGEETPLWRYMLDEAEAQENGDRLGEVGARITAETFIGLLAGDSSSFYQVYPQWRPGLEPSIKIPPANANFQLRDIMKFAGEDFI
jgi:hypothetical protein